MAIKSRTEHPPQYSNYRRYKPFLRREFSHSCYICEINEPELGGQKSFHIDHYRPQNLFKSLINHYENLFYACRDCNTWKSDYWPNRLQRLLGWIVLDPFEHKIEDHLDKSNFKWIGKSQQGVWNVEKFRLDSDARVRQRIDRQNLNDTVTFLKESLRTATLGLQTAQTSRNPLAVSKFQLSINTFRNQIDTLTRRFEGPMD